MKVQSGSWQHLLFYWLLFALLGLSLGLFVLSFFNDGPWHVYRLIYSVIIIAYIWYVMVLLFIGESKKKPLYAYDGGRIGVIIPVFNEGQDLFLQCLSSVYRCDGNVTILVVNDGSVRGIDMERLERTCAKFGIRYHAFSENLGKREALHYGVKTLSPECDYIVTIDSDTVLARDSLTKIVAPLSSGKVGATTGNVMLLNEKHNLLTRMVGAYYWIGLEIYKQAQSTFGYVVCCSGCIAAYRSDVLAGIIDEFAGQRFLGEKCTHSEDRHLTNLTLREGWDVKYVGEAVSYTHTPATLWAFMKQQQRWKRGFIRESTYTLTYAWRNRKMLFLSVLLCELTVPFVAFGIMLDSIYTITTEPSTFIFVILPLWIVFMAVRYSPLVLRAPRKVGGMLVYALLYELILYWQCIYALFTVRNKSWITRG